MKILLTGANGHLGRCFQDVVSKNDKILALGSQELDITKAYAVLQAVVAFQPDIIINTAAYTAVDKVETEAERATAVNTQGSENLAFTAKLWARA